MVGIAAAHLIGTWELRIPGKCVSELRSKLKSANLGRLAFVLTGQSLGVGAVALKAKLLAPGANLAPLRAYFRSFIPRAVTIGKGAVGLAVSYLAKKGTDALIGGASGACKIAKENLDAYLFSINAAVRLRKQPNAWVVSSLTSPTRATRSATRSSAVPERIAYRPTRRTP
jgi:hypothetical protein